MLAPIRPQRNLTGEVVARLERAITSGRIAAGGRLPTEQEMMSAMGVSRTVVREAVAALKAQGLVTTRQGSGAFVSEAPQRTSFEIDPEVLRSIDAVLDVLELRLAVETEAAGLACERATPSALRDVRAAHEAFVAAVDSGESAAGEDFAFHMAIARAAGNARFAEFLEFLGHFVIPRQTMRVWGATFARQAEYLDRIKGEHALIEAAIRRRDVEAARRAMREHLMLAATRYRRVASGASFEPDPAPAPARRKDPVR